MDAKHKTMPWNTERTHVGSAMAIDNNVTPAFIMTSDTGNLSGLKIGRLVQKQVGNCVDMVQQVRNLWRVYLTNNIAKVALISEGLSYNGRKIKVVGQNPYATGLYNSGFDNVDMVRIWIRDLPKSVSNEQIHHMFTNILKVELASEIKDGYYREGGDFVALTSLKNGDKYVFVHPDELKLPLPRNTQCGTFKCRLFYRGQFEKECYNCYEKGHVAKTCPNPSVCRVCKEIGHEEGSNDCKHAKVNHNLRPIGGDKDPLSNHFQCDLVHNHVEAKTSENHWFLNKGMKNGQKDLALMCLRAPNGKAAKYLSKSIRCEKNWDDSELAYGIMKDIVRAKINTVEIVKEEVHKAYLDGLTFVEAVPNKSDLVWGSSLSKEATLNTDPKFWPGKNLLGQIYQELAEELFGEPKWEEEVPADMPLSVRSNIIEGLSGRSESVSDLVNTSHDMESDEDTNEGLKTHSENLSDKVNTSIESENEVEAGEVSDETADEGDSTLTEPSEHSTPTTDEIKAFVARERIKASRTSRRNSPSRRKKPKSQSRSRSPRSSSVKRANISPTDTKVESKVAKIDKKKEKIVVGNVGAS